jgi:YebC/PmpR family DNA-binding regulatory protein
VAGHSHSANIKHKKAAVDKKRGKLWTKLSKSIIVAARLGGGDPSANARLRKAITDAKALSMPNDNIDRAVKRGIGELDGGNVEEVLYEGYGPHGVAVICDIMTDNRNRTAPEIRKLFEEHGGNLGSTGCVSYLFLRRGLFIVPAAKIAEDRLFEIASEAGADDIQPVGDNFEIFCDPERFTKVSDALEAACVECEKQVTRIPQNTVELALEPAREILQFLEALDDHDDVQNVSSNLSMSDEVMAQI